MVVTDTIQRRRLQSLDGPMKRRYGWRYLNSGVCLGFQPVLLPDRGAGPLSRRFNSRQEDTMMSSKEIDLYWHKIMNTVDELVACLEGLDSDSLNWRPLDDANSLFVLATHTMGNVRHNLLNGLCELPFTRDRDAEFMACGGSAVEIEVRWNELKILISDAIDVLPPTELDRVKDHPNRGCISGRELLVIVARHAAEHYGQAQLTRDLVKAQMSR